MISKPTNSGKVPAVWFPAIRAGSGADVFAERLCAGLNKRGIRAEITWLPHRAEYAPWTVTKLKPPAWANIVHVNTWLHRRLLPPNIPIVATMHHCVHGKDVDRFKSYAQKLYHRYWVKSLEKFVLRRAARIVAVSNYTAESTKLSFGVHNITVIHNGIDLNGVFQPPSIRTPHHPFRLIYAGNWSKRKGVDLLAPIMRMLGSDFELLHTGSPIPNAPANMHALGRLPGEIELSEAYQGADALLFPSRLEGFGLVVLESMACGLPVIATNGSSLSEVIENNVTGLLCPQDDVAAFANAARQLADNSALWQQMSQNARQRVEARFSMDAMIGHYLKLYHEVLTEHDLLTGIK